MTNKIVAIQGNHPSKLKPLTDTSIFLAVEAQRLKYKIFYYEPKDLSIINDKVIANGYYVEFNYSNKRFFKILHNQKLELTKCKYILIRQDPPFNLEYISTTYILDKIKNNNQGDEGNDLTKFTNQLINKITQNLEKFHYNVIVANFYETYNFLIKETDKPIKKEILIENYKKILILMNPFIPHFSNECLNIINEDQINWPAVAEEDLIEEKEQEIGLKQIELRRLESLFFGPKGDMFTVRKQLVKPIQDQVYNAIQDIATKKRYDFVLDKSIQWHFCILHK